MNFALLIAAVMAITILATGVLLAFTPHLMRRREFFAVTVPETALSDPRLIALRKRYTAVMLVVTVVCAFGWLPFALGDPELLGTLTDAPASSDAANRFAFVLCAAILVPIVVSFALMLFFRRKVRAFKAAEGWAPARREATAVVADDDVPSALPLAWNLLYVPVILFTAALGVIGYPSMPDMIPMHADFAGNVNQWEPKTPLTVGFPVIVQLFMVACFVFSHWTMLRSKRPTDPGAPATSALAYGLFVRAQSIFLLATGLLLSLVIGVVFMLSSMSLITLGAAGAAIIVAVVPVVVGAIALSVVYGQAGSRVFKRMNGTDQLLYDDDEHWKLGVLYFNPDDASLFLPERFGIGWTINLGRPVAWVVIIGFAAVTFGFIALVTQLFA